MHIREIEAGNTITVTDGNRFVHVKPHDWHRSGTDRSAPDRVTARLRAVKWLIRAERQGQPPGAYVKITY